jgi:hypothetical protein
VAITGSHPGSWENPNFRPAPTPLARRRQVGYGAARERTQNWLATPAPRIGPLQ